MLANPSGRRGVRRVPPAFPPRRMGLDATVRCSCLDDGTAADPPVPRDRLRVEDGYLTDAGNPWRSGMTDAERDAYHAAEHALEKWERTACPHPGMTVWDGRVSNWGGVSDFKQVLFGHGGDDWFPVLLAEVPASNGGTTPPDRARLALGELDAFDALGTLGEATDLLDPGTGRVVRTRNDAHDGVYHLNARPGLNIQLADRELRVVNRHTGEVVWASARFSQKLLPPPADAQPHHGTPAAWADEATGAEIEMIALGGRGKNPDGTGGIVHPTALAVRRRPRTPADYAWMTRTLRSLFTASVEAGQPVWWG